MRVTLNSRQPQSSQETFEETAAQDGPARQEGDTVGDMAAVDRKTHSGDEPPLYKGALDALASGLITPAPPRGRTVRRDAALDVTSDEEFTSYTIGYA